LRGKKNKKRKERKEKKTFDFCLDVRWNLEPFIEGINQLASYAFARDLQQVCIRLTQGFSREKIRTVPRREKQKSTLTLLGVIGHISSSGRNHAILFIHFLCSLVPILFFGKKDFARIFFLIIYSNIDKKRLRLPA
jgi:hypothetical protein